MSARMRLFALTLGPLLVGCSDPTGPGPLTTEALIGTWDLISLTYTSYATPVQVRQRLDSLDIVSDVLSIDENADYTRVLTHA